MPASAPVGAHVFVGSGLVSGALRTAQRIGAEAVQVFVSNPRGWAPAAGDPAVDAQFRARCADAGIGVFVHSPYLVNLGSPTEATRENSLAAVLHSLARGRRVGARGVVVHAGSAVAAAHRPHALGLVAAALLPVLDALGDDDPDVLIEPTAGGGLPLAATVEDLAAYLDALEHHPRVGVCLDTCHAFAAGHDVSTAAGLAATLDRLVAAAGPGRLRLVHANDSRDPLGSGRDRHANLGAGEIGADAFAALFTHPAARDVPVLVETPGDDAAHAADVATLVRHRAAA